LPKNGLNKLNFVTINSKNYQHTALGDIVSGGFSIRNHRKRELNMITKNLCKEVIAGVLFGLLLTVLSYAEGEKNDITIAIFPCTDVVMSFKKFHPLVTYLKEKTGFDIKLVVPKDSTELERSIKNGDIDFAFLDPHMYVRLVHLYDKSTLIRALTREGATSQSGVVIARKDSGIEKLKDLMGKTVMFGPKLSAARWVAAKSLFEEIGINIDKDLKSYSNGGCCEDVAFNVYLKAVDAGVVCDHFLGEHEERQQELGVDAKEILVITRTKPVPTRVFASRQKLNNDIVTKINQALLSLNNTNPLHKKILYPAELGGFQESKDEDYNTIRMLIGSKTAK
jgi:phosphate/phosphite/phosphonate ABC transporter binding protein